MAQSISRIHGKLQESQMKMLTVRQIGFPATSMITIVQVDVRYLVLKELADLPSVIDRHIIVVSSQNTIDKADSCHLPRNTKVNAKYPHAVSRACQICHIGDQIVI